MPNDAIVIGSPECAASVAAIQARMLEGHRRFVMGVHPMLWDAELALDAIAPGGSLVIEGACPHRSQLNRGFSGRFISCNVDSSWSVTLRGITFMGNRAVYPSTWPFIWLQRAHHTYFESCLFAENGNHGVEMGTYGIHEGVPPVKETELIACRFENNNGAGAMLVNVQGITIIGCNFSFNVDYGVYIDSGWGTDDMPSRILGSGVFSISGLRRGIALAGVRHCSVENCSFNEGDLYFGSETERCNAEHNLFFGPNAQFVNSGTGNTGTANVSAT
jgi:hypothetical protein